MVMTGEAHPVHLEKVHTPVVACLNDVCTSIDWYAQGQVRTVEVNGQVMTVRLIGRKGRRSRIEITAPAGATFSDTSQSNMNTSHCD